MINIENFRKGNEHQFHEHFKWENKTTQKTLGHLYIGKNKQTKNPKTKLNKQTKKSTPQKKK